MLEEGDLELYCLRVELDSDLADGDLDLESLPDRDDNVVVLLLLVDLAKANMKWILNPNFIYELSK